MKLHLFSNVFCLSVVSLKSGTVVGLKYFIFNSNMKNVNIKIRVADLVCRRKNTRLNGTQGVFSSLLSCSSLSLLFHSLCIDEAASFSNVFLSIGCLLDVWDCSWVKYFIFNCKHEKC